MISNGELDGIELVIKQMKVLIKIIKMLRMVRIVRMR